MEALSCFLFLSDICLFFFFVWYNLIKMLRVRPICQSAQSVWRTRLSAVQTLPVPYIGAGRRMASTVSQLSDIRMIQ
jgi:hypothetical protein